MTLHEPTPSSVRRITAACLLLWLAVGCAGQKPSTPGAPDPELQGQWNAEGMSGKTSLTIEGDSLYFYSRPDHQFDTTFTTVAGTDPSQLRTTILESPRTSGSAGEVVFVIYKIADEVLTMAVVYGSAEAPSFEDADELYEFEKAHPEE